MESTPFSWMYLPAAGGGPLVVTWKPEGMSMLGDIRGGLTMGNESQDAVELGALSISVLVDPVTEAFPFGGSQLAEPASECPDVECLPDMYEVVLMFQRWED